ncbi:MAG TPA: SDR family NAD(P)-dependent oxidoreductase [Solirubrobacteraceae bacterium]|nr:SDR family NAD(P)-dependent oxidoreductase [Solirubrobacteraceae bacterium]
MSATRNAIVTGGTGGLGTAVTRELLAHGWHVTVPWRERAEADRLLESPGVSDARERLTLVEADLFDPDDARRVVSASAQQSGTADTAALVNLVGGFAAGGRVHETPVEDFERQFQLNLRPAYLMCAAVLPELLERGGGAIVCVSTRAAKRPFAGAAGYIASKAAVLAFVEALATEYTQDGVRANAVLPSVIDTPGNRAAQPQADHSRWVAPAEIAKVIRFLCSEESAPVSGAHVPVYGRA